MCNFTHTHCSRYRFNDKVRAAAQSAVPALLVSCKEHAAAAGGGDDGVTQQLWNYCFQPFFDALKL
jgi:hypothetical protein